MLPHDLHAEQFADYPPEARKVVIAHLNTLKELPISFLPGMLKEVIDYDFKFPAERSAIDKDLIYLSSLSQTQIKDLFQAFALITLPPTLEQFDWINLPSQFIEQQSAYLWSTHQMDAFRKAATEYGDRLRAESPADTLPARRLGIAIIGQGVSSYDGALFQNLRQHGTYFADIKPDNGLQLLLAAVAERAKSLPKQYGHWYIDGGRNACQIPTLTCVSYGALAPVRAALLKKIQTQIQRPGMGPEELRTYLARLTPTDVGMDKAGDPVLDRFLLKLLTEGSGTQIFSTTFAQWATREALRRAHPLTLLVRFAPRQQHRPMNEMLSNSQDNEPDLRGSLIDADMGAYYHWINQQRLPGFERSSFLVWFEGHSQALAIGSSFPRGSDSSSGLDLGELVSLAAS
jgi:hypothetical protein